MLPFGVAWAGAVPVGVFFCYVLRAVGEVGSVRTRPWIPFILILIGTLLATWIALPGQNLNVFDVKTRTETKLGLDLKGGLNAVLQARPAPGQRVDSDVLSGLRDTIERRVNGLGVSEPIISTQGNDKIVVDLPGVQNPEEAVNILKQTALLELVGSDTRLTEGTIITTSLGGPASVGINPDGSPLGTATPGAGTPAPGTPASGTTTPAPSGALGTAAATAAGTPGATITGTAAGTATAGAESTTATAATGTIAAGTTTGTVAATPAAGVTGTPEGTAAAGTPGATAAPATGVTNTCGGPNPATLNPTTDAQGQTVYPCIVQGKDLADAFPQTNQTGSLVVGFKLDGDAARTFGDYTGAHVGRYLNVVVDKRVVNSAVINSRIDASGVIEGLDRNSVNALVVQLKSGRLAVPLELIQTRSVGPTLGQDSINKSLIAAAIGIAAVAVFMIVFYRLPGVLAVLALAVYTVVTFALFKLFGVVLTLAGIAGFVLSIGMAVDANVLIFARMKEELRAGRTLRAAIEGGFDHAWPSIRDSNVSTTITCLILYVFGGITGTTVVRGFALTLLIGVLVSLFSAITVTRTFLRCLLTWQRIATNRWLFNAEASMTPAARRGAASTAGD